MLEAKRKVIGNIEYEVRQLTVPVGRRLLMKLFKTLGPAVGAALTGLPEDGGKDVGIGDMKTKALGDAIGVLAETLTEEDFDHVCHVFTDTTQFSRESGKWLPLKIEQDLHWAGRYMDMMTWLAFCLEVNYADFLGGQTGLAGFASAMQMNTSKSPSPTTSTGTSTESPRQQDIQ